ncbi:MAG: TlpA family protein disulfide reductase [Bdellovibrionaceae bacterium]|nr:TlpA family protein disulfide reductase [Pseudobdellovibrionaceae bacterium]
MLNRTITYRSMSGLATLLFVVLLSLIYFNSNERESPASIENIPQSKPILLKDRIQAPNIIWKDNFNLKLSLENYKGKVVYLNLWAHWCEPCKQEIPFLANIYSEFVGSPFEIILINLDTDTKEIQIAQEFLEQKAPQLTSYYNVSDPFIKAFKTHAIPTHILLDKSGEIALHYSGDILEHTENFKSMLQHLFQENLASH